MNRIEQCPCCEQKVELVGSGALEAHTPIGGAPKGRTRRAGIWCDGSGYTADQARRWSALTEDAQRELLANMRNANHRAVV
jgi:hypothetical protein